MTIKLSISLIGTIFFCGLILSGCWIDKVDNGGGGNGGGDSTSVFQDVSSDHLPTDLKNNSTAAQSIDVDNDGDLDLVIAVKFEANKLLINDGSSHFSDETSQRLPLNNFATEDVVSADFNGDGFLDLFFANHPEQTNGYYVNNGDGTFTDVSSRLPPVGPSYAVAAADINSDGMPDLILGNDGKNQALINDGRGHFSDQSAVRLPNSNNHTRDLAFADINGDGSLDLLIANEEDNRVQLNMGGGFFVDRTQTTLPLVGGVEETRDINVADVNDDGRPDLYFGNVIIFQSGTSAQDRLLINRQGRFTDVTDNQLPPSNSNTVDADFFDIDGDGDFDIITSDFGSLNNVTGNYSGNNVARVLLNNGSGSFSYANSNYFPANFSPKTNDFEIADFNGDGRLDIYVANYNTPDVLLLRADE